MLAYAVGYGPVYVQVVAEFYPVFYKEGMRAKDHQHHNSIHAAQLYANEVYDHSQ